MKSIYLFLRTHLHLCTFLVSGCVGVVIFLFMFGWSVVDPSNINWIQSSESDLSQHYIGWLFYRQSEWAFPLGSIPNLAYPHGIALTFMDSIPLFAIPFKLFASVLPETFQYFGIWGILSFFLQGGIAGLIIFRLTKRFGISVIASVFFSLSPVMLDRIFGHTALAGHWIILLSILLALYYKSMSLRKFVFLWSVVLSIGICVHPYFLPMTVTIMAVAAILGFKKWYDLLIRVAIPSIVALIVFWAIGGLLVRDVAAGGLGAFATNFNTLINPLGWSAVLPTLPISPGGYEGFAYLGLGVIILTLVCVYKIITHRDKRELRDQFKRYTRSRWLWTYVVLGCLLIAAISPTINVNDHQLVIKLPSLIEKVWSVFRATGRLFWPLYYILIILVLVGAYKLILTKKNYHYVLILFALILSIQVYDIAYSSRAKGRHDTFTMLVHQPYASKIHTAQWEKLARGRQHLQYLEPAQHDTFFSIAYVADKLHLTMSDGYFARSPIVKIQYTASLARAAVLVGVPRSDTLYVTEDPVVVEYVTNSGIFNSFKDASMTVFAKK